MDFGHDDPLGGRIQPLHLPGNIGFGRGRQWMRAAGNNFYETGGGPVGLDVAQYRIQLVDPPLAKQISGHLPAQAFGSPGLQGAVGNRLGEFGAWHFHVACRPFKARPISSASFLASTFSSMIASVASEIKPTSSFSNDWRARAVS